MTETEIPIPPHIKRATDAALRDRLSEFSMLIRICEHAPSYKEQVDVLKDWADKAMAAERQAREMVAQVAREKLELEQRIADFEAGQAQAARNAEQREQLIARAQDFNETRAADLDGREAKLAEGEAELRG